MYTLLTTKLVMVINKAHIKIILLMAFYIVGLDYYMFLHFVMTIKHNSVAYLGCVVDNMADYVSYVYSKTSEINLRLIFGRL